MKQFILSFLFLSIYIQSFSQAQIIAATAGSNARYSISYQKHKGYILLNTGEKVEGFFQYAADEFPTYNIKQLSLNNKTENRYKSKEIQSIMLAGSDTILSNKDSTYFFVFKGSSNFWRQLSFNKDVQVFDCLFNVNERPGLLYPRVLVLKDGQQNICKTSKDFINWMRKNASDKIHWSDKITVKEIIRQLNGLA